MKTDKDTGLSIGDRIGGYTIHRIAELKEIGSVFYELAHAATGARHVHIRNRDSENAFAVAFKTVPQDSTGVAHILEHTVLCGSRKYPVRDPFFAMLKRSLSTFMNAFTASDWTAYPFSTQNRKDFYNLLDVYLDAAFFPKLEELSFKQEGHRLEVEDETPDAFHLAFKGVVYNEMKGAMSSPDQIMVRSILNALYPDTTYSQNSGGDPAVIPSLTYEQLKAFHQRHYHPSNGFFYTYGDLPLQDHLSVIEETVLSKFDRIDPKTEVPSQPRWNAPREASYRYPLDPAEDPTRKCQACVAWLTADIRDGFNVLSLALLEQILLGNAASPLRKALIDSGLGAALCDGSGFDADSKDTLFVCGLKATSESSAGPIESIVFDVLTRLVDEGIDRKLIDSAVHQLEFHRKEITNTPYPYGLNLFFTFAGCWLHGGDPVKILCFDADLNRLNAELAKGPFFENQINKYLLTNCHRARLTLLPDQHMQQDNECRERSELEQIKNGLSASALAKVRQDSELLRMQQESQEDISCLPTLGLADIPPTVATVPPSGGDAVLPITWYAQPTSGIFYFAAVAGAGVLPERLVPLLPIFCYTLPKIGTRLHDYTEIARSIDACTGGIGLSANSRTRFDDSGTCLPFMAFNAKCLYRNQNRMFELVQELLHEYDFSDSKRLKELLLEYRTGMESMVIHNGHRLAISLASRNFSTARALGETWSGIHQLRTIKALTDDLSDDRLAALSNDLQSIGTHLLSRNNFQTGCIGEQDALEPARPWVESIVAEFAQSAAQGFGSPPIRVDRALIREGWSTSTAVSFVAVTFEAVPMSHPDSPTLSVISKLLRSLYLHREIREKGGAYGGFAVYSPEDGLFSFGSYRDPHVLSTLQAYEGAADFIRSGSYDSEDVQEAILQVCAEIDKPDPPGPAAKKAFFRKIVSLSDEMRLAFKQQLLDLTVDRVREVAGRYFGENFQRKSVAAISNEAKLAEANAGLADRRLMLRQI
jgi:Zn-dependent M16 (insulinase) family peptidase